MFNAIIDTILVGWLIGILPALSLMVRLMRDKLMRPYLDQSLRNFDIFCAIVATITWPFCSLLYTSLIIWRLGVNKVGRLLYFPFWIAVEFGMGRLHPQRLISGKYWQLRAKLSQEE